MIQLSENLFLFRDTCNVYVIRRGDEAVLIDFGSGDVLDALAGIGVTRVTDVLMTHHHRDQGQGLRLAVERGARIWVPYTEQELFSDVNNFWQAREIYKNYNMRQDRFSLLESVPIAGTLQDYAEVNFSGTTFTVVPTPGHTIGSISLMAEIDGSRLAFTGDLITAPGKLWSLAATQWTYNGGEGLPATVLSLLDIQRREPARLLPSHGNPMDEPTPAIDLLVERLLELMRYRRQNPRLLDLAQKPYEAVTPHLLHNRTSVAKSYVVLSESGKALFIDYGYDFVTGFAGGFDRASQRPWLYTLDALKSQFGVKQIDVVMFTHFHDDHVSGANLLRQVEGTRVWAAENFADILADPCNFNLPCLWYDPIPVDRVLPLDTAIQWEEYAFTLYPLPGHTLHAVGIFFEVDGKRVLAAGDQYQSSVGDEYNYVYQNRYQISDYVTSAALYRRLAPDLILTGHWDPLWVPVGYFDNLEERGLALERLHRQLLPLEDVNFDAEGIGAWIHPYQAQLQGGQTLPLYVDVLNPLSSAEEVIVKLVVPEGWQVKPAEQRIFLDGKDTAKLPFEVTPPVNIRVRRARIAADLTVGTRRFGQQAEALITVV
jgi:glyoxylase-like metal-dependent hydrolase (beta-lactamase superfamily II)